MKGIEKKGMLEFLLRGCPILYGHPIIKFARQC